MSAPEDMQVKLSPSPPPDPFQEEPTVLILVGLIASGKSTFAEALEGHFPRFRRCNQDDLGNRQQVEELAYHTLCDGRSPCIDRTNFNATYVGRTYAHLFVQTTLPSERQRSYWSAIARASPRTSISIIVFDTPYHVCASRLQRRTGHPTIRDARHGMTVLQKFASDFQMPSADEEYDHIVYLRPEDHPRPEYTRNDILLILERLKASTRDTGTSVTQRSMETYFGQGRSYSRTDRARGYRGGDGYRGFSSTRGSLHGSPRFTTRVGGSNSTNWRRPSSGVGTNRERPGAKVPSMEGSKTRDSVEECHK